MYQPSFDLEIPSVRQQTSLPLVNLGDTLYRFELRFRWQPSSDRSQIVAEITDDATRELLGWQMRPSAQGDHELTQQLVESMQWMREMQRYLAEPFPDHGL